MIMTINTQGMSYGNGGSGRSIKEQRDAIPPMKVNKMILDTFHKLVKHLMIVTIIR